MLAGFTAGRESHPALKICSIFTENRTGSTSAVRDYISTDNIQCQVPHVPYVFLVEELPEEVVFFWEELPVEFPEEEELEFLELLCPLFHVAVDPCALVPLT